MSQQLMIVRDTDIVSSQWSKLLNNSKFSSAFQSWEFYKSFNAIAGLKCHAFALQNNDNEYKGD